MFENLKEKYLDEITYLRRELHKIPETGFNEYKTQEFIINYLTSLGLNYKKCAETGVICYFNFNKEESLGIRADIDALKITETNEIPFKSTNEGYMHACGHDGHTAILLCLAKYLAEEKKEYNKNILLIFQPAEEGPGGAKVMIEEGILEKYNVKNVIGLHIQTDYPKNKLAVKPGPFYASSNELYITVKGSSTHAAHPETGIDAIKGASAFVLESEKIMNEFSSPKLPLVISLCTFNAGSAVNIIAKEAKLTGIMRALNEETERKAKEALIAAAKKTDEKYKTKTEIFFKESYPVLENDKELFLTAKEAFGKDYMEGVISMGAEDFSYFARSVPSLYFLIGAYDEEKGFTAPGHNDKFNFDEEILIKALEGYVKLIQKIC